MSNMKFKKRKDTCKSCDKILLLSERQVGGVHMDCEHKYFHEKTLRMIKIRPGEGYPFVIITPKEAEEMLNYLSPGEDGFYIESIMMAVGEVELLPEFEGW